MDTSSDAVLEESFEENYDDDAFEVEDEIQEEALAKIHTSSSPTPHDAQRKPVATVAPMEPERTARGHKPRRTLSAKHRSSRTSQRRPRRVMSATTRCDVETGAPKIASSGLRRHASAGTERSKPRWDDRHHLSSSQSSAVRSSSRSELEHRGEVSADRGHSAEVHAARTVKAEAAPFVGASGSRVKAVVNSSRSGQHVGTRMRQQLAKVLPAVDKGLPWKDPRRAQRRRPVVEKPPYMRGGVGGGSKGRRSPPGQRLGPGARRAQHRKPRARASRSEPTVRDLAQAHQLRRAEEQRQERPPPREGGELASSPGSASSGRRSAAQAPSPPLHPAPVPQPGVTPPRRRRTSPTSDGGSETPRESQDASPPPRRNLAESPALPTSGARPVLTIPGSGCSSGSHRSRPSYVQTGLSLNMGAMLEEEDALEQTYEFTASGAFTIAGFEIKEAGLTRTPVKTRTKTHNLQHNLKQSLVRLSVLGRGASGIVHKALHVPTLRLVALKTIPCFEQQKRHQMLKELRALHTNVVPLDGGVCGRENEGRETAEPRAACPHIVSFYDAYINPDEGNVSIVMEYMDGGSLQDIVDAGGCASERTLANIAYQVLEGLAFLHARRQIHRDIKPSNLLINHDGDVKITDFGITTELSDTQSQANSFVGTLTFMSPERIAGGGYSSSADIWAFGLSLMACALGRFPIETGGGYWGLLQALREAPPPVLPERHEDGRAFSAALRELCAQCLRKDPGERPGAAQLLGHPFLAQQRTAMRAELHSGGGSSAEPALSSGRQQRRLHQPTAASGNGDGSGVVDGVGGDCGDGCGGVAATTADRPAGSQRGCAESDDAEADAAFEPATARAELEELCEACVDYHLERARHSEEGQPGDVRATPSRPSPPQQHQRSPAQRSQRQRDKHEALDADACDKGAGGSVAIAQTQHAASSAAAAAAAAAASSPSVPSHARHTHAHGRTPSLPQSAHKTKARSQRRALALPPDACVARLAKQLGLPERHVRRRLEAHFERGAERLRRERLYSYKPPRHDELLAAPPSSGTQRKLHFAEGAA